MNELSGQIGELRFVIEVTRKDTGKVEHYDMVGKIMGDPDAAGKPKKGAE